MQHNLVFFTHQPISHIHPIKDLLKYLTNSYNVYCFGYIQRKVLLESYNVNFIQYPVIKSKNFDEEIEKINKDLEIKMEKNDMQGAYELFLKIGAIHMHYIEQDAVQELTNIIKDIKPFVIFHDIVDLYAPIIAKKLGIKRIDYVTNNYYSFAFFQQNPTFFYSLINRASHLVSILPDDYFIKFLETESRIYHEVEKEYHRIPIQPFSQFYMNGELNLIFSYRELQPQIGLDDSHLIIEPIQNRYDIEDEIPNALLHFIKQEKEEGRTILYASLGSFITEGEEYYCALMKLVKQLDYSLVISCGKSIGIVQKLQTEMKIGHIYAETFLPQKFLLSKIDMFLTCGGFNSIQEAIFYQVPMLINPVSAEQRLNAYILEKQGFGESLYGKTEQDLYDMFQRIETDKNYIKAKMKDYIKYDCVHNLDMYNKLGVFLYDIIK